jgi:hypothetical protein
LLIISNNYLKQAPNGMVSSLIFQKNSEGLTEPPPQNPCRFFSDFAFGLGFALNSQALHALDLSFTLD